MLSKISMIDLSLIYTNNITHKKNKTSKGKCALLRLKLCWVLVKLCWFFNPDILIQNG